MLAFESPPSVDGDLSCVVVVQCVMRVVQLAVALGAYSSGCLVVRFPVEEAVNVPVLV